MLYFIEYGNKFKSNDGEVGQEVLSERECHRL